MHPPNNKKVDRSACEFMVDKVTEFPNEVSILALGPLTNLALVSQVLAVILINKCQNIVYIKVCNVF
jgi:inosine-uridine nucleoside N-ribohydrolase